MRTSPWAFRMKDSFLVNDAFGVYVYDSTEEEVLNDLFDLVFYVINC